MKRLNIHNFCLGVYKEIFEEHNVQFIHFQRKQKRSIKTSQMR